MKRFLNNITDLLADAALLEMGVDVNRTSEHRTATAHVQLMATLKRLLQNFSITMEDAALLEIGVYPAQSAETRGAVLETLEENIIEVAFAEAADYDDIHKAILREHQSQQDIICPEECQYGDNDVCFV